MKLCSGVGLLLLFSWLGSTPAIADTLDPALLKGIGSATFEVVLHKPENSPVTYEKPLPLDQLPFQERNDKYYSIGTAFEISPGHYVTAFHVMEQGIGGLLGAPELRDASGHVYAIDQITKFSLQQDFVEFTLAEQPKSQPLPVNRKPQLNTVVYAVGNALGTGVVIRDGLFTSETPEDQDGRWKWLRFSAAASPGNSGGPLLDASGKVIGVVLMKSANENLNFALPIGAVLDASTHVSHMDKWLSANLGLTEDTSSGFLRADLPLPQHYADFAQAIEQRIDTFYTGQFKQFLGDHADSMFPRGAGSHAVLASKPVPRMFPMLLHRGPNGIWRYRAPKPARESLSENGYVALGSTGSALLFHLRKPDSVSLKRLYADPKLMMDLLLKTGMLSRTVGAEKIRLTSLGNAIDDEKFVDDYERPWQVHVFAQPYANLAFVLAVLPVPDGYVGMMQPVPARVRAESVARLRILSNFFNATYDGSFAAWKEFLSSGAAMPEAIRSASLDIDYGKRFAFSSPTISLTYTPQLQRIEADGELIVALDFVAQNQAARWQIGALLAQPDESKHDAVRINNHLRPYSELEQGFQASWKDVLQRAYPQNDQPFQDNGMKWVGTVAGDPAKTSLAANPDHVYTVFYGVDGTLPDATMQEKLKLALQGTQVH